MGLGELQRMTARLIDGLELRQDADSFSVSFLWVWAACLPACLPACLL